MIVALLPLFFGFLGYEVHAQSQQPPTCTSANWTTNNEGQSPCQVGTALINACTPNESPVPLSAIKPPNSYQVPSGSLVNPCTCSSVTYAMLSACAVCQGSSPGPWSGQGNLSWITNCPANIISLTSYPGPVPSGIFIPVWAFQDVSANGAFFNPALAQELANEHKPDATTGVDPITTTSTKPAPTSTSLSGVSSPSSMPNQTSPPVQTHKKTSGGVIAGAVVGSLIGVVCIALAAFFYIRYRKERTPRRHYEGNYEKNDEKIEPSLLSGTDGQSAAGLPVVNYPPLKLYDPEDPSTFPTEPLPTLAVPTSPSAVSSFTHSRNNSEETTVSRTRPTHSRQSSSDTTSIQSSTLAGTVGRNTNASTSGYNPSGIIYRTIPE